MSYRIRMGCLIGALALAGALIAYAGYLYSTDFLAADSCLDGGGSYHYDRGECSFTENYGGDVLPLWPF